MEADKVVCSYCIFLNNKQIIIIYIFNLTSSNKIMMYNINKIINKQS